MQGSRGLALLLGLSLICNSIDAFVTQLNRDCIYRDSVEDVKLQYYLVFNKQVLLWYDPGNNLFIPCPSYMCISEVHMAAVNITTFLNGRPDFLNRTRDIEDQCRRNREQNWGNTVLRTVPPIVRISPVESGSKINTQVLVCYVFGFFPGAVNITWLKNGHVIDNTTLPEVLPNGDWTYQTQAHLEVMPQSGDSYTCSVEHASRQEPFQEKWEPGLTMRQKIEISVSVVILALGITFLVTGIICWKRSHHGYAPMPGYNYPEVS